MMYCEFIEGTGCKDNEHNYEVYRNLETMYMNSDMSKQEVYEYGKKLVDNSKTEAQIKLENEIKAEIAEIKEQIKDNKQWIESYEESAAYHKEWGMMDLYKMDKSGAKWKREENRQLKIKMRGLKWVLES